MTDDWMAGITVPREPQVVQIGPFGPAYLLEPPHTVESIREDARYAAAHKKPFACRFGHFWQEVGKPHEPEDLTAHVLNLIATFDYTALMRCPRCRKITQKGRF